MASKQEYNASSINAVSQHVHLLKRLSLTFGRETGSPENPFSSQKSVAIREIIDNGTDEVLGGHATRVKVSYLEDGSFIVQDNGRGIPVDTGYDSDGKPTSGIYLCLGVIQSGGKFGTDSKRFSSGLNGVGSSSSVHTSKRADVTVYRDNKIHELSFKDGTAGFFKGDGPDAPFEELEDLTYLKVSKDNRSKEEKAKWKTGTIVKLWLRDSVYSSPYGVDTLDLTARLRGIAYLIPNTEIEIYDEVNKVEDPETFELVPRISHFKFDGFIPALVEENMPGDRISPIFLFQEKTHFIEKGAAVLSADGKNVSSEDIRRDVEVDVAFAWDNKYDYNMESYVNTIRTRLGGVHETAFEKALLKSFGDRFRTMQGLMTKKDPQFDFKDFAEGLTVVISTRVSEPEFTGQSKEEVGGVEFRKALMKVLTQAFDKFVNDNKNLDDLKIVGKKVVNAARDRQAAKDQQEINRKKNAIERVGAMPDKLLDCELVGDANSEFYIVEGDSAKTSLKDARVGKYQALLPIRGKIINATKNDTKKVLNNKEIQDIIQALGCGINQDCDPEKCRYGRIFIAADADADGGNIAALLLSFFWEYMRPLIEANMIYMIVTPLFVIKENPNGGKKRILHYAFNEAERNEITTEIASRKKPFEVQRLKGLGEGDDIITNETAMNPLTRTVHRVTLKDVARAQDMIDTVFGDDSSKRKEWISSNPIDERQNIE